MLEKVRTLKEDMGISYKVMAEKAGINYNTFRAFVNGRTNLNQENQEKLKKYLSQFQRAQHPRNRLRLYIKTMSILQMLKPRSLEQEERCQN